MDIYQMSCTGKVRDDYIFQQSKYCLYELVYEFTRIGLYEFKELQELDDGSKE